MDRVQASRAMDRRVRHGMPLVLPRSYKEPLLDIRKKLIRAKIAAEVMQREVEMGFRCAVEEQRVNLMCPLSKCAIAHAPLSDIALNANSFANYIYTRAHVAEVTFTGG